MRHSDEHLKIQLKNFKNFFLKKILEDIADLHVCH